MNVAYPSGGGRQDVALSQGFCTNATSAIPGTCIAAAAYQNAGASCPQTDHPIHIGTGNKYLNEADFAGAGSDRFRWTRYYNSQIAMQLWTQFSNGVATVSTPTMAPQWTHPYARWIQLSNATMAYVFRPDGGMRVATPIGSPIASGRQTWLSDFVKGEQVFETFDANTNPTGWIVYAPNEQAEELYDVNGRLTSISSLSGYVTRLTYSDGSSAGGYVLDGNGNPTSVALPVGLQTAVSDNFGRVNGIGYDQFFRVKKVTDPMGQTYLYSYDANSNLTSVLYPDGNSRAYLYNETALTGGAWPNALTGIIDENGTRMSSYTYDSQGRATNSSWWVDAGQKQPAYSTSVAYLSGTESVVTDALNTSRAVGLTTSGGVYLTTGQSQPGGAGCGPASNAVSYDANGNVASRTDFDSNLSCYANDLTRNIETARLEGIASGGSCPASLSGYSPPAASGQRLIQTQWHPTFKIKTAQAAPLNITNWIYNGQPDPTNGNALISCAPSTPTVSANEDLLLMHFDGANGSTTFTDVDGNYLPVSGGSPAISTAQSVFGGASLGLNGSSYLRGTISNSKLNIGTGDFTLEFRVYVSTAAGANIVGFVNTSNSQQLLIGMSSSGTVYGFVQAPGAASGSGWGSPTALSTGTWHALAFERSAGTAYFFVDGNIVASGPDATNLGSLSGTATFYVGGSSFYYGSDLTGYIDELRFTGAAVYPGSYSLAAAPLGHVTTQIANLLPDPIVLCKKVGQATTDATGGAGFSATALSGSQARVWTYTYNQYGQVLTATGPRGNLATTDPNYAAATTAYQYYAATDTAHTPPYYQMGDLQQVIDAAGHTTTYLRYDGNGRVLQQVDPNGTNTTFTYYPRGWLQTKTVTPPSSTTSQTTSYVYDGVGQLKTVTQPDGSQINYTYDAAHRLTIITDSAGDSINYTLDAMGNRTTEQVKDPGGNLARQVTRVYDALNRLQTVTGALQ